MAKSQDRSYYVYILTNSVRTLYVGVTSDLFRRIHEHRQRLVPGFTRKYNLTWLAYYEETSDVESAIAREKQIKKWRRSKKIALIEICESPMAGLGAGLVWRVRNLTLDSSLRSE